MGVLRWKGHLCESPKPCSLWGILALIATPNSHASSVQKKSAALEASLWDKLCTTLEYPLILDVVYVSSSDTGCAFKVSMDMELAQGGDVFFRVCWKRLNPYSKCEEIGIVKSSDLVFLELIKVALKSVIQPNLNFLDRYSFGLTK